MEKIYNYIVEYINYLVKKQTATDTRLKKIEDYLVETSEKIDNIPAISAENISLMIEKLEKLREEMTSIEPTTSN